MTRLWAILTQYVKLTRLQRSTACRQRRAGFAEAVMNKINSRRAAQLPYLADAVKTRVYLWRRRAATIAVGALALVMAYGVVFGHNGLTAFARKRDEARTLQRQMQDLQRENEELRGHVDRLQSDPGEIEHEARAQLHYTRPGEVIYTVSGSTPTGADTPAKPHPQTR